jgi:hypothetical protein
MERMRESLGENISSLVFSGNVRKSNLLTSKSFTNGMTIYFNIFGALMKNGIGSNLNSTGIISMKRSRSKLWNTKFA